MKDHIVGCSDRTGSERGFEWKESFVGLRRRLTGAAAGLVLAVSGGVGIEVADAAPSFAAQVNNMMLCEPDTGWCFQTNPPYNPAFPHACQWDYKLNGNNLRSGMYYTGCTPGYWGPAIH